MNSKALVFQLVKENGSAYKVAQLSGISEQKLSTIRNGRRNFSADDLALLVESDLVSKSVVKNVLFLDRLKDKKHFEAVASVAIFVPVLYEVLMQSVYYVKYSISSFFEHSISTVKRPTKIIRGFTDGINQTTA